MTKNTLATIENNQALIERAEAAVEDETAERDFLPIVKFIEGEWLDGDGQNVTGQLVAVNMASYSRGQICFDGTELKGVVTVPVLGGKPMPSTDDLEDFGSGAVWKPVRSVQFKRLDANADESLFSTTSDGGAQALSQLFKKFTQRWKANPSVLPVPICRLSGTEYMNRTYGKIVKKPSLPVVRWTTDDDLIDDADTDNTPPPGDAAGGSSVDTAAVDELDDEIPY